ncbi:hypothetical protein [Krasilnikovia sp. MM14-A1004]|uniref:hypothetical protein n=1 Tax=Krasilnikovia sp. MM14-A1004 TaxID=3373541 RepID=UPI00399CCAF8
MPEHRTPHDTAAELRSRIGAFEDSVVPPPGLVERVTAPEMPYRRRRRMGRWRWPMLAATAAAVVCLLVGAFVGAGWQRRQQEPPSGSGGISMTVYNTEAACQPLRTIECGLGVRRSPYRVPTDELPVARVWHGDTVVVDCVVIDGRRITDEQGVSSTRWYKVRTPRGAVGFLPAVRTRNSVEVRLCPQDDVPR